MVQKSHAPKRRRFFGVFYNSKPLILLLLVPLGVGLFTISLVGSGLYYNALADIGSKRLETPNWQEARDTIAAAQPSYQRKFTYYKIKDGQTLEGVASRFGVPSQRLIDMNPGQIVVGTTIKIPPLESPLTETAGSNGLVAQAEVIDDQGMLRIKQKHNKRAPIVTTIPELMGFLAPYGAIEKIEDKTYRLNKAISLEEDIRLDMTPTTIKKLEINSPAGASICLCFDDSAALIKGVEITSFEPASRATDMSYADGRSFVRMKNGRLDIIDSRMHHLGTSLDSRTAGAAVSEGGMYGVSWRISAGALGRETTTGWIENTTFDHNHFGAYTLGASGMMWRGNVFAENDVYGLDPHDDSNNALIENNVFYRNYKHGFIMSVRCNYNVIRGNLSLENAYNGYMLHDASSYNLIENNVSYANSDNFVVYDSHFNTIRGNVSYAPHVSHIRMNQNTSNTFITHNELRGGKRGLFFYTGVKNALVEDNTIQKTEEVMATDKATNVIFTGNTIDRVSYDIGAEDRMIYGANIVEPSEMPMPSGSALLNSNATYRANKEMGGL